MNTIHKTRVAAVAITLFLLAGCGEKGPCPDSRRDDERHAVWADLLPTLPLGEGDELCTAGEDALVAYHTSGSREEIDQRYIEWLGGLGYQEAEVHRREGEVDGHTFVSESRQLQWTFVPYISLVGVKLETEPRSGPVVSLTAAREARDNAWERVRTTWPTMREGLFGLEGEQVCDPSLLPTDPSALPREVLDTHELQRIAEDKDPTSTTRQFRLGTTQVCNEFKSGYRIDRVEDIWDRCTRELNGSVLLVLHIVPKETRWPFVGMDRRFERGVLEGRMVVWDLEAQRPLCHAPVHAESSEVVEVLVFEDEQTGREVRDTSEKDALVDFQRRALEAQKSSLARIAPELVRNVRWRGDLNP